MSNGFNCILSGVGGQGTVLASKLLAAAAMSKGLTVRTAETIGMAQRGGCVVSHVRISDGEIYSPLIPLGEADMIIGFEPGEAVRTLPYLKKGGSVVVSGKAVPPVTAALSGESFDSGVTLEYLSRICNRLTVADTDAVCKKLGSTKVMNLVLLGAAVKSGIPFISKDDLAQAVKTTVKPAFYDINILALNAGADCK